MVGDRCAIRGVTVLPSPLPTRRQTDSCRTQSFSVGSRLSAAGCRIATQQSAGQRWSAHWCHAGRNSAVSCENFVVAMEPSCERPACRLPIMWHPAGCRSSTLCNSLRIYTLQRRRHSPLWPRPLIRVSPSWPRSPHSIRRAYVNCLISIPLSTWPSETCRRRATRARDWRDSIQHASSEICHWSMVTHRQDGFGVVRLCSGPTIGALHIYGWSSGSMRPASSSMTRPKMGRTAGAKDHCNG